jgi:chromosome partitioning protein
LFSIMDGDDEHRVDAAFSPVPRPGPRNDAHCGAVGGGSVHQVIVVTAALKGGVGKTTTSIYLAALATANRNVVTLVDADPQASAAEWVEAANDEEERFDRINIVEAPTDRLLVKTLDRLEPGSTAVVDPPPSHDRLLGKALERASVVVVPARVGGIETAQAHAVLEIVPDGTPVGLVICSARTFTRSYGEAIEYWRRAGAKVWGTVPERVTIAAGPSGPLAADGLDAYRKVWRRVLAAARSV